MRVLGLSLLLILVSFDSQGQEDEIRSLLIKQQNCWNNGDLECFMEGYWKSDKLVFVGSRGPQYGWKVTLNNYKKSYPDRTTMGVLTFDLLKFIPLGTNHQLVIGKWSLQRDSDNPNGHFSLVFKKIKGKWLIIADHSS